VAMSELLTYPDTFLKQESDAVKLPLTLPDQELISKMKKTMYQEGGIGLAAIQVGYQKRVAVIDVSRSQDQAFVIINPSVVDFSEAHMESKEGCLSAPGKFGHPRRNQWIKIEYVCEHGKKQCKTFYNMKAIVIQHELDHMNGKMCIDYE
tara:strand:- start:316 stop:765 length:450 start_codon:yes stop_codon:yes gene_type:complete